MEEDKLNRGYSRMNTDIGPAAANCLQSLSQDSNQKFLPLKLPLSHPRPFVVTRLPGPIYP